jgi:two-component SAPR family response regulator
VKAILVDDEALALAFLEHQLNKIGSIEVIGKFNNLNINKHDSLLKKTDVIFLDIEMPEINGIELAEKILEINPDISIVFVTAFNDYAVQAFELNAVDYVLKPIQLDRLSKTLERVKSKLHNTIHKPAEKNNRLHVHISRELGFSSTTGIIEFLPWRTAKSQELFLYLLHHHGKTIRKSELIELLWTDFQEDRAYSQLYTAIYHIRKTLKTYREHFKIKNTGDGYTLWTNNVSIDLAVWERYIIDTPLIDAKTIQGHEENMKLYKGDYLQECDYIWAEAERYRLAQLWLKTAYRMADFYEAEGNMEKAGEWYAKISAAFPEEEDAHLSLMKLYARQGADVQIDRQYHQLSEALEELGLKVSSSVEQWVKEQRDKHQG